MNLCFLSYWANFQVEANAIYWALRLASKCLGFDFIGTHGTDTDADVGVVQIPHAWRALFEDENILGMFFQLYKLQNDRFSPVALECLVFLTSVRRSLFSTPATRERYLETLLTEIIDMLSHQIGLDKPENHHEICRLLVRLKTNYQLAQLVQAKNYNQWITLVAEFTVKSLEVWHWSPHSIGYLLQLWSRLVGSLAYLQTTMPALLDTYAPRIMEAWVLSRMQAVEAAVANDDLADMFGEEEKLSVQLDALANLGRCRYRQTSTLLHEIFTDLRSQFIGGLQSGQDMNSPQMQTVEGQLIWLVSIISSLIGGRMSATAGEEADAIDGELSGQVLELMKIHESRLPNTEDSMLPVVMELAIIKFFQAFRRMYIGSDASSGLPRTDPQPPLSSLYCSRLASTPTFKCLRCLYRESSPI